MTKAMYIGVDGVARKVKAIYVGVDGVARKVKSGYVGVDGVARQFYTSAVTVTINQPANGTITANYNGTNYTSSFTVTHGAFVTFTCTPNSGYKFTQWQITGNYSTYTTEDGRIAAVFESNAKIDVIMEDENV